MYNSNVSITTLLGVEYAELFDCNSIKMIFVSICCNRFINQGSAIRSNLTTNKIIINSPK